MRGKYAAESIGMSVCVWNCPGRDRRTLDKRNGAEKRKDFEPVSGRFFERAGGISADRCAGDGKRSLWYEPAGVSDNCGSGSAGCSRIYLDVSAGTRFVEAGRAKAARCSSKSGASAFLAAVFGISGLSDVHGLCLCFI